MVMIDVMDIEGKQKQEWEQSQQRNKVLIDLMVDSVIAKSDQDIMNKQDHMKEMVQNNAQYQESRQQDSAQQDNKQDVDLSEFDKILQESEQDAEKSTQVSMEMWNNRCDNARMLVNTDNSVNMYKNRYSSKINKLKTSDKLKAKRIEMFGGGKLNIPVSQNKEARYMFDKKGYKPKWAVWGCVLLRARGVCEVCEEQIMSNEFMVKRILPRIRDGKWIEENCVCICAHCAECWFPYKEFFGLTIHDMFDRLSVAVMERRHRRFHGVKDLNDKSLSRYIRLKDIVENRNINMSIEVRKRIYD